MARRSEPPAVTADEAGQQEDVNVVVIVGETARDASATESADGTVYTSFEVVCRNVHGRTLVPVTVEGECALQAGQRVAVLGRVHKRFFAAGAGLASRTDVRAERVTVVRRKSQVARVIASAAGNLGL